MAASATDWRAGAQLLQQGKAAAAVESLSQAATAAPADVNAQMFLGIALAQAGRPAEGVAPLRRAVALNPTNTAAQFNLGCVLERAGDEAGAVEAFQAVLQVEPGHTKARQALAKARQRLDAAAAEPEPVQELVPLGGPDDGTEPPAAAPSPPPPTGRPSRVKAKPKGGAGVRWLVPALAVLLLGGAAAACFLFFASSPAKTATKYLAALQREQYDGLERICTRSSHSSIAVLKQTTSAAGKLSGFELGETTKQGTEATVKVKLSLELPAMARMAGGKQKLDLDTVVCLAKEGMSWRVDVNKTQTEMGKALFARVFGAAFQRTLMEGMRNTPGMPAMPAMPGH